MKKHRKFKKLDEDNTKSSSSKSKPQKKRGKFRPEDEFKKKPIYKYLEEE